MIQLLGGHKVHEIYFNLIKQQVLESLASLAPNEIYLSRFLCGGGFWALLTRSEKRLAGRCVAFMVAKGILPFRFFNGKKSPSKLYKLKG